VPVFDCVVSDVSQSSEDVHSPMLVINLNDF
jgi:hypothetical protein